MSALLHWTRSEDEKTFEELLTSIRSGNCAAFIGSGLSKNANYPTWGELLLNFSSFVEQRTGKIVTPSDDYYLWAEKCKETLDDDQQYQEFLLDQFGPHANRQNTTDSYIDIDRIPYSALITTNYDPCIINASRSNSTKRKLHSYPILDAGCLHAESNGHIFHIHGIICPDIYPLDPKNIIFTQSEYDDAYAIGEEVPNFLYQLVKNHDLLFLGFSLDDKYLLDQVQRIWKIRNEQEQRLLAAGLKLPTRKHYAILPTRVEKSEIGFVKRQEIHHEDLSDDQRFSDYGITVLRYKEHTTVHRNLINIIRQIRQLAGVPLGPSPVLHGIEMLEEI